MPGCENDERNLRITQRIIEVYSDYSSSVDSSFDSESHGIKDTVSQSSIRVPEMTRLPIEEQPVAIMTAEDEIAEAEQSCLHQEAEPDSIISDNYLTVSGTIQRGRKKGQCVDVILNMSREELEGLEASLTETKGRQCGTGAGPHIFLFSLITAPIAALLSAIYSFFIGTLTWYNIFYLFVQNGITWRIIITPFMILSYPFLIVSLSSGVGLVSAFKQITWYWREWVKQNSDLEKGFFGWLCNALKLPDCAPYEVVILSSTTTMQTN